MGIKKTKRQVRCAARVVSFALALVLVLGGTALKYFIKANRYEREVENGYQKAFTELSSNLDAIKTSLHKSLYVTSPALLSALCTDIYAKASAAQMTLEELPYCNLPIENTSGFIAKTGDYAYALSRMVNSGQAPGDKEYEILNSLYKTSAKLSDILAETQAMIYSRGLLLGMEADASEELLSKEEGDSDSVSGTIMTTENDFPELPTLIYDGPFSEHIEKKEAERLKGSEEVTKEEAAVKIAEFMSVKKTDVTYEGENASARMPTWRFSFPVRYSRLYAQVTKRGGEVLTVFGQFNTGEAALTREEVEEKAGSFLRENGYENMSVTYTQKEDGTMLVNYAATQGGVVLYPDLVKVRVAMDDGTIIGFEASGYLMSHRERDIPEAAVGAAEAEGKASPALKVLSSRLCIIPTAGSGEVFCREVKCETREGGHCLLYINALSGAEEKLLLLIEDENGTLTI